MSFLETVIEKYGEDSQIDMVQEECAELIQAISKYKRAIATKDHKKIRECRENIIEEMSDVNIMFEQLQLILNIREIELCTYKSLKLNRLRKRLADV